MSRKKLNAANVLNELKGQSAFFNKPKVRIASPERKVITKPPQTVPASKKREISESKSDERTEVLLYDRTDEWTNVRNTDRVKIRHAFDIYEDQLRELHTRQLEAVRAGKKKPGLGEMVQQALDEYIKNAQRVNQKEKHTSGRTNLRTNEQTIKFDIFG